MNQLFPFWKQLPMMGKHTMCAKSPLSTTVFLLLDGTRFYTFGASFKDLGKKLFCFSLMESEAVVETVKGMVDSYADFAE